MCPFRKVKDGSPLHGKMELLLEFAPDAVLVVDAAGRILLANAQCERLFGYRRDALLGQAVEILVPDEDHDRHRKHRNGFEEKPGIRPMGAGVDLYGQRQDGGRFPVEISLSPLETEGEGGCVTAIIRDVSERKRAEGENQRLNAVLKQRIEKQSETLREVASRTDQYLDVVGVAVVVIERDHRVALINKKGCEILGYQQDEVIGKNWFDHFIPERMRETVEAEFEAMISGKAPLIEYDQNPVLTQDKKERLIAWHNTVLRDETGQRYATLSSGEDITEKTVLEQKVRQAEKMAAVGQFASCLAHEIGSPLSVISGRAEFALRKMPTDDPLRDHLEPIVGQINRITKIIQQLLNFTRPKPPKLRALQLGRIFRDTLLLFEHQFETRGIKAKIQVSEDLPDIVADRDQVQQVFLNLMINAIHAMPQGGNLILRAAIEGRSQNPVEGPFFKIDVVDTGIGIPPEKFQKIFDPFYSTKEPGEGTGLGLTICENIVRDHGGWMAVSSRIGEGAVISVFLPLHPPPAEGSEDHG